MKYWTTFKSYAFKYLFDLSIPGSDSVIKIGIGLNGLEKDDAKKGFIEFNPNKLFGCSVDVNDFNDWKSGLINDNPFILDSEIPDVVVFKQYLAVFGFIYKYAKKIDIARYDLAVDFPVERGSVLLLKDKREYGITMKASDDYTEYLGQRDAPGFTKVYNKQKESKLAFPVTRLEITWNDFIFDNFQKRVPSFYFQRLCPSGSVPVVIQLLSQLPESDFNRYWMQLDLKTRKKYQSLLINSKFEYPEDIFDYHVNQIAGLLKDDSPSAQGPSRK